MSEMTELPTLDEIIAAAKKHRDNHLDIIDRAQVEVDRAEAVIQALQAGKPPVVAAAHVTAVASNGTQRQSKEALERKVPQKLYRSAMVTLADLDEEISLGDLASLLELPRQRVGLAMNLADYREHIERAYKHPPGKMGGKVAFYKITERGIEWAQHGQTMRLKAGEGVIR